MVAACEGVCRIGNGARNLPEDLKRFNRGKYEVDVQM